MGPTASLVTVSPVIFLASGGPPTVTSPVYATFSPSLRALYFLPNGPAVVPDTCPAPADRTDGTATATRAGPGRRQSGRIPAVRPRRPGRSGTHAARCPPRPGSTVRRPGR